MATKVYVISNKRLFTDFQNYRDSLHGQHQKRADKFKSSDWKKEPKAQQREAYLKWYTKYSEKCPWKHDGKPEVIPMLQGTSDDGVWQICQNGFGKTGATDDGFYGAGVYFTSKLNYASQYSKAGPDGKPFVIVAVTPGNTFPVVEHPSRSGTYKGKGCRNGYQSHFTLVDGRDKNSAFPIEGPIDETILADELVTFDHSQPLPLFVFYTK